MATIKNKQTKKPQKIASIGEDVEKLERLCPVGGTLRWKTVWRFLKKFNIELPYDPAILLLDIYPPPKLKTGSHIPLHPYSEQQYSQ